MLVKIISLNFINKRTQEITKPKALDCQTKKGKEKKRDY